MGPRWECPPEYLANGRKVYRCMYGHFHEADTSAWSCGGPSESTDSEVGG